MQNATETEKEAAIARAQEEQIHLDRINELLTEASREERRAIATLAVASIDLATGHQPYVIGYMTLNCTIGVKEAYRHIRHISEEKKSAIAIDILSELFPPDDDDDDDDDEIAVALSEGRINKAFRDSLAKENERAINLLAAR